MSLKTNDLGSENLLIVGEGDVRVIAVHGWMGDRRLFQPLHAFIDKSKFTFAFMDCRGYGSRKVSSGPFTIEQIGEDVLSVADALEWETFHVIGHSMAGMTVQRLMIDQPKRLRSAIMLAPVPASGAKIDEARRALLREAVVNPEVRRTLIDANTGRTKSDEWLTALTRLSVDGTTEEALSAYMRSWTTTDFSQEADGIQVRSLAILGEIDPGAQETRMRETIGRWYPDLEIEVMQGTGHYPMQERPEQLYGELSKFLLRRP